MAKKKAKAEAGVPTENVGEDKSKKEAEKPEEVKEDTKAEVEEAPSENVGKDIVEEEKEDKAVSKEQDYNSIFDDEYVEDDKKEQEEEEPEAEEEAVEEKPEEEAEVIPEPKDEKPQKQEKKKVKKKKEGFSKKKILTILAAILLLLVGAFLGWKFFSMRNEIKEVKKETAPTTTKPEVKEPKVVSVTADNGLNMRESADSKSKSLAIIPNGTKLTVLEEKDGWYKVEYNGQTGWVSKDFVTETNPDDMKTYTGTGFSPDGPKFSVKYPSDWTVNDYKISKTAGGNAYVIALGEGGHGGNDDPAIVTTQEDVTAAGTTGKKTISKKDGKIVAVYTQFLKGDGYINIEFNPPVGYEESYIDIYNKILESFQFI